MPTPRLPSGPAAALALVLVLIVAACGTSAPSSGATTGPDGSTLATSPTASQPPAATDPAATDEAPTDEPPTEEPTEEPTETGPVETGEPSDSPDRGAGAAACSGNDDNRLFYARTASAVGWSVLCAVLPKGWYVSSGQYRLADGGRLLIGYNGPAGATLRLSEGAFCGDDAGCVPPGEDVGDAPLGPLSGTLVRLDDGGFAVVVARGENPSWLLETRGLDEATTRAFAAALAEVEG